jgi:hypothetical protein
MWQFLALLLVAAILNSMLAGVGKFFIALFLYVILPGYAIMFTAYVVRRIYHHFSPDAKKAYEDRKQREKAEVDQRRAEEDAKNREIQQRAAAEAQRERAEADALYAANLEAKRLRELQREQHRDADTQTSPFTYQIGQHGNEALAIRYGIANQERKVVEYWYHGKGGQKLRNPERDKVSLVPASTITLRKTKKLSENLYEVCLTDHRDRIAKAVIEPGTDYVKTFYPLDDKWFETHKELEGVLKGNGSFTLKELATFHVQKAI